MVCFCEENGKDGFIAVKYNKNFIIRNWSVWNGYFNIVYVNKWIMVLNL